MFSTIQPMGNVGGDAEPRCAQRQPARHAEDHDRHQQRHHQRAKRRQMCAHVQEGERHQHEGHGNGGYQGGEQDGSEGIVDLLPGHGAGCSDSFPDDGVSCAAAQRVSRRGTFHSSAMEGFSTDRDPSSQTGEPGGGHRS